MDTLSIFKEEKRGMELSNKEEDLTILVANLWADDYVKAIKDRFPKVNIISAKISNETEGNKINENVEDVDIIFSFTPLVRSQPKIKDLKWFHSQAAGYEHILKAGLITKQMLFTSSAGVAAISINEFVFSLILTLLKNVRKLIKLQEERKFDFWCSTELHGKTLGILGLGNLGRPIAKTGKMGFDMTVIGWDKYITNYEYTDNVFPEDQLDEVFKISDILVVTLPLTPDTDGLIGERELKLMKQSAYLINVARGDIIVKEAFLKALSEKWIAGAAVDAFWGKDPADWVLPPEDKLWEFENVLISPHTAWFSDRYIARDCELLCDNLERFIKGEELINIVTER